MKIANLAIAVATLTVGSFAFAQNQQDVSKQDQQQDMSKKWEEMRKEAISAKAILAGDIKSRFSGIGQVEYLILNETGDAVEYVIWDRPQPLSAVYLGQEGFLNFDAVDVEYSITGDVNLIVEDAEVSLPRDELKITRSEADHRMVDKLIGSKIEFKDGTTREVEDILIHPETGKVTHYVVAMDPDDFFEQELRAVRVNEVEVSDEGNIRADLSVEEVEQQQDFDIDFLG
ncbi:hypothetical protein F6455_05155 [Proteobacteria bacterium 005FR1]|nr:hypothetical protein [Proteobacteria bacterium 005FR1]